MSKIGHDLVIYSPYFHVIKPKDTKKVCLMTHPLFS